MSTDTGFGGVTRRELVTSAAVAAAGAGAMLGAVPLSSDEASASVTGIAIDDVSVAGEEGRLASLTVAPGITTEWSDLSRSVAELTLTIAAKVQTGASGDVATHTTADVSGSPGSYSHSFDQHDLLTVLDADTFHDDTADGEQFGPAPVDVLSFKVSVDNVADQYDPCRAEPEACEGVSMSGSMNTGASAENPTD